MKFLHWLGNAGKVSVATLAGLGGVAAVAGVASWVYLGGENTDNTSFNFAGNPPSNIVYSVGGNADYSAGSGEGGSDLLVSSRNIHILDEQTMREEAAEQMAQSHQSAAQAFSTSGGVALLGNSAYEGDKLGTFQGNGENPMAALSGLNDVIAQAQGGMGGGNGAGGPNGNGNGNGGAGAGNPALASQRPDWGSSAAIGGNGGGGVNNQFVTQANGLGRSAGGANGNVMEQVAGALQAGQNSAQAELSGLPGAGGKFRRGDKLGNNLDSGAGKGNQDRIKASNRLRFAQKRSAAEAKNQHRMAMTTAFVQGERNAGGITLTDGAMVTTGQWQESADMSGNFNAGLKGLDDLQTDLHLEDLQRGADLHALQVKMWKTIITCFIAMLAIVLLVRLARGAGIWAWVFWAAAALVTVAALLLIYNLFDAAGDFSDKWGSSGFATACKWVSGALVLGVGASWFMGTKGKAIAKSTILETLGISAATTVGEQGVESLFSEDSSSSEQSKEYEKERNN